MATKTKLLYRSEGNKIIAGVAAGLGEYLDVDPSLIRLGFVIITLAGGSGILLYLILWLIIPSQSNSKGIPQENIKKNVEEIKLKAHELANSVKTPKGSAPKNSRNVIGILILALGVIFLFQNFGIFSFMSIEKLWPLILILIAFSMLKK